MGRSVYTPSTLAYLVQTAVSSSTRSSSPSTSSFLADSGTLSVGHEEIKYGQEQEQEQVPRARGRSNKDAPMSWAERSFDPDDENLPVVTERFLGPGEEQVVVFGPVSDDDEEELDEEEASEYGSEDEEEEDDHVLVETVEIERIIEEAERDAGDGHISTELEDDDDEDEDKKGEVPE